MVEHHPAEEDREPKTLKEASDELMRQDPEFARGVYEMIRRARSAGDEALETQKAAMQRSTTDPAGAERDLEAANQQLSEAGELTRNLYQPPEEGEV